VAAHADVDANQVRRRKKVNNSCGPDALTGVTGLFLEEQLGER